MATPCRKALTDGVGGGHVVAHVGGVRLPDETRGQRDNHSVGIDLGGLRKHLGIGDTTCSVREVVTGQEGGRGEEGGRAARP